MISDVPMLVVATVVALIAVSVTAETSSGEDQYEGPLLSTFKGIHRELIQHPDGTYRFSFSLPQQDRQESRDADGKVTGSFSFVDNGGQETSVRFDADHEGYRPESDAIPKIPEDTDDVQSAREEFLRFYEQTVKFLEELGSDEDDSDSSSSSEESDEYDYEDEDDSSEEDDDDDDDSSSEEDSEEDSDEEDSDEEEEEEDDEEEEGGEEEEEEEENEEEEEEGEENEEEEEGEENQNNYFRVNPQRKFSRGFGSRVRQQDLSRSEPAKQTKRTQSKAVFPSPLPATPVFGRRISYKGQ